MSGFSPVVVEIIWTRDQGRCAWCGEPITGERGIDWSVHHRLPRSMGGTKRAWVNQAGNGVLLHGHGSTGCHAEVEKERDMARHMGFLVSALGKDRPEMVPVVHKVHGRCYLLNEAPWVVTGPAVF